MVDCMRPTGNRTSSQFSEEVEIQIEAHRVGGLTFAGLGHLSNIDAMVFNLAEKRKKVRQL
jgi:hypothetical protein